MKKLQTILITGSLPYKLYIEKLDTISPTVGKEFSRSILIAAIVAFLAVCLIIYLRFKKPVLVIPVIITLVSEVLLTFGIAAIIKWNIDLPSIAGIIAAIGTGVDDQIVMLDESQVSKSFSLKERIKRAFFIIFAAYATVLVSLFPLWFAGAGLLRGFALTTAIGITVGVFITRPAFAEILDKITKED
jgi:preprotein translocase subunit SecD